MGRNPGRILRKICLFTLAAPQPGGRNQRQSENLLERGWEPAHRGRREIFIAKLGGGKKSFYLTNHLRDKRHARTHSIWVGIAMSFPIFFSSPDPEVRVPKGMEESGRVMLCARPSWYKFHHLSTCKKYIDRPPYLAWFWWENQDYLSNSVPTNDDVPPEEKERREEGQSSNDKWSMRIVLAARYVYEGNGPDPTGILLGRRLFRFPRYTYMRRE